MSIRPTHRQRCEGVTLVELLVGLAVGGIVTLAVIAAWGVSVRTSSYTLESARLNNDLRSAMQLMSQDLRRADGGLNMPSERAIQFSDTADCVTYFVEGLGRGFRLNDDGIFQMYFLAPNLPQTPSCTAEAGWVDVYEGLAPGGFRVSDLELGWTAVCYPFTQDEESAAFTFEEFNSDDDGIATYPRCINMSNVVEVLGITILITGEIGTSSGDKSMTFTDSVMVRNHDVR